MVRYFFILLLFVSCISSRNEYGRTRVSLNRFNINPKECYPSLNSIDTSSFYQLILNEMTIQHRKNMSISLEMVEGFKFYRDGKVSYFVDDVDLDPINSLNPKKALMGIYNCDEKKIRIESIVRFPQSGIFVWKDNVVNISKTGDTISIYSEANEDKKMYKKVLLDKKMLVFKPDW